MTSDPRRPAVFLDRDQTLIKDPGYISNPDDVVLLDGAAESVTRLRGAGLPVVVVTNQSGVARGLVTEDQLASIHQRMQDLLLDQGTSVDAIYYCPYLDGPEAVVEPFRQDSDLRKPKPGMLTLAAREMNLDLAASWMIGDSERDIQAGHAAGCRAVRIDRASGTTRSSAEHTAPDLRSAVDQVLSAQAQERPTRSEGNPPTSPAEDGPARDAKPAQPAGPSAGDPVREQILDELRAIRRDQQHEDFSLGKLAGAIAQAFALCAIGWGLYSWVNASTDVAAANNVIYGLLAGIVFQLMTLTCFFAASKK